MHGFLPLRADQGVPWGFSALEPPAEERDFGWVLCVCLWAGALAASLGHGALGSQG